MKSANWISQIGRMPARASPMPMPTIEDSASGVSSTRPRPKAAASPSVARNTPPRGPTSSPSTSTRSSAAIRSCWAWRIVSTTFRSVVGPASSSGTSTATSATGSASTPSGVPGVGRTGRANTRRTAVSGEGNGMASARRAASPTSSSSSAWMATSSASGRSRCSIRYWRNWRSGSFFRHASTSSGVR